MLYKVSGRLGQPRGLAAAVGADPGAVRRPVRRCGSAATCRRLRARVLAVQGLIGVAFLAFLLFTSNPFWRLAMPPMDGQDLNPLLQDPGLAFHPPFLYLGLCRA
jgi:cytochrome c-type biogenesis protein CcmF